MPQPHMTGLCRAPLESLHATQAPETTAPSKSTQTISILGPSLKARIWAGPSPIRQVSCGLKGQTFQVQQQKGSCSFLQGVRHPVRSIDVGTDAWRPVWGRQLSRILCSVCKPGEPRAQLPEDLLQAQSYWCQLQMC